MSSIAQIHRFARCTLNKIPSRSGTNLMNNYYVLRHHDEFKVIYMDGESANRWFKAGWELRNYDSNEKAQHAMAEWEASIPEPVPFLVRRQA
jgi:hypothetical protein